MHVLPLAAPFFLLFEVWQLFICERYLGIKQIARGADPRELGLAEATAFLWSMAIFAYWLWMALLLLLPTSRVHGLALLLVTLAAFAVRRGARLKHVLVILSIEGAVRFGLLVSLCGTLWWRRHP